MEVIVLLKQVPSTESEIKIAEDGRSIQELDIKWVINPYDEFAIEEALRIREAHDGTVTILSVGPERTGEAIRTALAMGADRGILINDAEFAPLDGLQTARWIAAALKTMSYDIIIAGQRAVDADQYLVGTAVAELLGIPMIPMVIEQNIEAGKIRCHRTLEGGSVVIEAPLPALFTTQRGLNEPRYTSLPGIMKAKKKPLDIKTPSDFGIDESLMKENSTRIVSLHLPPSRSEGQIIQGETAEEKAVALVKLLKEDAKVI